MAERTARAARCRATDAIDDLARPLGLLTAYWRSDRRAEAWGLTGALLLLTTILSKASVWAATASADFLAALARFHAPGVENPAAVLALSAAAFLAIHAGRAGGVAFRHLVSTTLHRRARAWLVDRYDAAVLGDARIAYDLASDAGADGAGRRRLPDALDQRIDVCTDGLYAGFIGLLMGFWGSAASIYFVGRAIAERSAPVPALDRAAARLHEAAPFLPDLSPGDWGSAVLVCVAVASFVPAATWLSWRIGRVLERQTLERQRRDGAWRGELVAMQGRVGQLAASQGHAAQRRVNAALYGGVDGAWAQQNVWSAALMLFGDVYNFLARRLVSWAPGLPAFMAGGVSFRSYAATSELTAELIGDVSWFITVMPAIATLRANIARLTEVAEAVERVRARDAFYAETGVAEIRREAAPKGALLQLKGLRLRHRGFDAGPFLTTPRLTLGPGDRVVIRGANGCGKSSLLKAIAGIWPYGSGTVAVAPGARMVFAGQEPDLPDRRTLKALALHPEPEDSRPDLEVAEALARVGLGAFIGALHAELHDGKPWRAVLSGGQKQRLVLARLVLLRPDILLLDEATAALDPSAAADFHHVIAERLPDAAVLSILHGDAPPTDPQGAPFHGAALRIERGVARLGPDRPAGQAAVAAE